MAVSDEPLSGRAVPGRAVPGKKGAVPPDPRVVIPKLEDYIDVSALGKGLPAAPGVIDRESRVTSWPMYANGPDPGAPPVIAADGVGDCTCAGIAHSAANVGPYGIDHCVVLEYSAFDVPGIVDDQTVITWGIEQKINQAWALTYIGQALGLITEDWIAANGTSIKGQSLAQLIADSKTVRG
jgi:hypothetical protein